MLMEVVLASGKQKYLRLVLHAHPAPTNKGGPLPDVISPPEMRKLLEGSQGPGRTQPGMSPLYSFLLKPDTIVAPKQ